MHVTQMPCSVQPKRQSEPNWPPITIAMYILQRHTAVLQLAYVSIVRQLACIHGNRTVVMSTPYGSAWCKLYGN